MKMFFKGFVFALGGLNEMLKRERNFRIEVIVFFFVITAGVYFAISPIEWTIILLISALVLSLEMINTSIEKICDMYSSDIDERIKLIKDVAAGAVLLSSIISVVIGFIVFWKYFKLLF